MKKILSLVLVLSMIIACMPNVYATSDQSHTRPPQTEIILHINNDVDTSHFSTIKVHFTNTSTWTMNEQNSKLYKQQDNGAYVSSNIDYFLVTYDFSSTPVRYNISPSGPITLGTEGGGTINYWMIAGLSIGPDAVDDGKSIEEDHVLTFSASDLLSNDTSPFGLTLRIKSVEDLTVHGNLVVSSLSGSNPTFTYTPDLNYNGTDTFKYTIVQKYQDHHGHWVEVGTDTALVTITVTPLNDPPVADDETYSTDEDVAFDITAADLLTGDVDIDGDTLMIDSVGTVANGTLTAIAGGWTFTPNANWFGSTGFDYVVSDGNGGTDTGHVTISVRSVNDGPVAEDDPGLEANNDAFTTPEDTALTLDLPLILSNDVDVESDPIHITGIADPDHGSLAITTDPDTGYVTSAIYTPDANFVGNDTFVYTITDGLLSDSANISVDVTPVNDEPIAENDRFSTLEDVSLTLEIPTILANDSDVDEDDLFIQAVVVSDVTHGTLNVTTSGSAVVALEYVPEANWSGTVTFGYTVSDGNGGTDTAVVTIDVYPVNDGPVAVDDARSVLMNNPVTVDILTNDYDIEDDSFGIDVFDPTTPQGGSVTRVGDQLVYTPATGFTGVDTFNYTIIEDMPNYASVSENSDYLYWGLTDSAIVTITVTAPTPNPTPTPTPTPVYYNVSVSKVGEGSVTTGTFLVQQGDFIIGSIIPADGWELGSIGGANGAEVTQTDGTYRISVNAGKEIIVTFVQPVIPETIVPETVIPEIVTPEAAPVVQQPEEVAILDAVTPQAGLPNTGALPMGIPVVFGAITSALGFLLRKKNEE